jgi:hypothetical protein
VLSYGRTCNEHAAPAGDSQSDALRIIPKLHRPR